MIYEEHTIIAGKWLDKKSLKDGCKVKIIAETKKELSRWKNDDGTDRQQDVTKIQIEGNPEGYKLNLNRTTINGLVKAFGKESKDWQGKILTVAVKTSINAGKENIFIYLIPDGFELSKDEGGYLQITKIGETVESIGNLEDDILDEQPF